MIHVIAVLTAKPGQRGALLDAIKANLAAVRAEQGCIEYGAAVDLEGGPKLQKPFGADCVLVLEKWDSLDALKAHGAAPHMVAHAAQTKDMLQGRAIHILTPA